MVGKHIDLDGIISPERKATRIAEQWVEWNRLRSSKLDDWEELRNYVYATSTSTTANALLPWSNTTTTPKLTQIADNLHANYIAAMFPRKDWFRWMVTGVTKEKAKKKKAIESYIKAKIRGSGFMQTASLLVQDWILYGNCFATVEWVSSYSTKETGVYKNYVGPRLVRISPFDIVFNPAASSFAETPKIIRSIYSIGELKKMIDTDPSLVVAEGIFERIMSNRKAVNSHTEKASFAKDQAYTADGFSNIREYYNSNSVEVLTFYGDYYDHESQEYHSNRVITVVDRAYVLQDIESPSWLASHPIYHTGWRNRPDNLWSMGPLDNLVGLQYRLDHLENLKADVFDQIAVPTLKIRGNVEDFEFAPGSRVYLGEEGDVSYLVPDATALNADFQIEAIERRMEEMAGAPKSAMGIRTPGEKTAFEVSSLMTSSNRIFEHKAASFEEVFTERVLNAFLEAGRRQMVAVEEVAVFDELAGEELFESISRADLEADGVVYPVGARHFAERARRVQNINQLYQIKAADPTVGVHISGKEMAKVITEELGEQELYGENITLKEQAETRSAQEEIEVDAQEKLANREASGV